MITATTYIAPQQLQSANRAVGAELCRAMVALNHTLNYGLGIEDGPYRDYAELREAKSLLSYVKYPDPTEPVRLDELAWALARLKGACADRSGDDAFDKAAHLLNIDLSKPHPLPADLKRKIDNALCLVGRVSERVPLAKAG